MALADMRVAESRTLGRYDHCRTRARKGGIAVGADADLAIWDPELTRTVRAVELHSGCDYSSFEGTSLTGWPVTVLARGEPVVLDGKKPHCPRLRPLPAT